jgi:hypothetical protein
VAVKSIFFLKKFKENNKKKNSKKNNKKKIQRKNNNYKDNLNKVSFK